MKSDARYFLNKKKWSNSSDNRIKENWRNRKTITHGKLDARKILESKRNRIKPYETFIGSHKPSTTRKDFSVLSKNPQKHIEVARDGNIWVTSNSKTAEQAAGRPKTLPFKMGITVPTRSNQESYYQWEPSASDTEDLEHTAIDDLIDMQSLPPALVMPKSPSQNRLSLSRKSLASQVLSMQNTMVADQLLPSSSSSQTVKVYVTNLGSSVSKQDIMELFGDVGLIKSADMLQPGTALIEFYDREDANKACDIYHNRLLDGQPMKCYIQSSTQPQRTSISQRLGDRIPAKSATSSVAASLPSNSRSRYNPRNVQFTVKLT